MMKTAFILPLALLAFATPVMAQSVVTPAPSASPTAIPGVPVCDAAKQDSDSTCAINSTSPECLGAKKTYISCMAGYDAANGKGPCAEQKSIMLQYCTSDQTLQQCRNARVSYNSCIENPPGY